MRKLQSMIIGIYFEANGHGTILFSEHYLSRLEARTAELSHVAKGSEQHKAALRLLDVSELINQAVGDALSGDLLSRLLRAGQGGMSSIRIFPVGSLRSRLSTELLLLQQMQKTVAVTPPGIQEAIDAETVKYRRGRCFIRPSGTEDVICVYAEAFTDSAADSPASSIAKLVDQSLGFGSS
ncbi:hypothetical protein ACFX1Q_047266 [Malus domestica]